MTTALFPNLAHLNRPDEVAQRDPRQTWPEYQGIIEDSIVNAPRSLQKRIGPSEIGTECTRCLILKLGGVEEIRDVAWLTWVGSAVHAYLENTFATQNETLGFQRFLIEERVHVGDVNDVPITGKMDLFDLFTAGLTDWKIVGKSTLDKVKRKSVPPVYRAQSHLYASGSDRRGLNVHNVRIAFLPRNAPSLDHAFIFEEPYSPAIAEAAIKRADFIAREIAMYGLDVVLETAPAHQGEYSCSHYPSDVGTWQQNGKGARNFDDLAGLIIPTIKI
jgi:hypothetical protein